MRYVLPLSSNGKYASVGINGNEISLKGNKSRQRLIFLVTSEECERFSFILKVLAHRKVYQSERMSARDENRARFRTCIRAARIKFKAITHVEFLTWKFIRRLFFVILRIFIKNFSPKQILRSFFRVFTSSLVYPSPLSPVREKLKSRWYRRGMQAFSKFIMYWICFVNVNIKSANFKLWIYPVPRRQLFSRSIYIDEFLGNTFRFDGTNVFIELVSW